MKPKRAIQVSALLIGLGGGVSLRRFYRRLEYTTDEDERHIARTSDGWRLALYHYRPRTPAAPRPVVLAHGFGSSHVAFDLGRGASLARALADRGFDVYCADLRGRGDSWPEGGPSRRLRWDADDLVRRDVPAIVQTVGALAASPTVDWVGMDLGGQVALAALADGATAGIHRFVGLGCAGVALHGLLLPGVSAPPRRRRGGRLALAGRARRRGPVLALARSQGRLEPSLRSGTTDPVTAGRYLTRGLVDESVAIGRQLGTWIDRGAMVSTDGVDWSAGLGDVGVPSLLVSGETDRRVPLAAVRATAEALGGPVQLVVAGRSQGFSVDFGHDDLVMGRTAPVDVWPVVADWLASPVS